MRVLDIKTKRVATGMSQGDFAVVIDTGQSVVAMWESGRASPRAEKLPVIAEALGCSIDDLYAENEVREAV